MQTSDGDGHASATRPAAYIVRLAGDEPGPRERLGALGGVRVVRDLPHRQVVVAVETGRAGAVLAEIVALDGVVSVVPDRLEHPLLGAGPPPPSDPPPPPRGDGPPPTSRSGSAA